MSENGNISQLPQLARDPLAWSLVLALAGFAWIPTLEQTLGMGSAPMYGTMGMTLLPFLGFWTVMMAAMMLPALAPTVSVRVTTLRQQTTRWATLLFSTLVFILGYLLVWGLFGIPVFICCFWIDHVMFSQPLLAIGLGIGIFVCAGLYQFTPQKKRALFHCNPAMSSQLLCQTPTCPASMRAQLREGLQHGIMCLRCCGILMLILIAVGLMNLFWMVLMTMVVFLEKVWVRDYKLSTMLGCVLIFYGFLTIVSPWLLPGLYIR